MSASSTSQSAEFKWWAILEMDFCPWANRWVYWLKNFFWVLLVAGLTAVTSGVLSAGRR